MEQRQSQAAAAASSALSSEFAAQVADFDAPETPKDPPKESIALATNNPLQWTYAMERAMYSTMLQQHYKGKRTEPGGFKSEAWTLIVAAVQKEITTGQIATKTQCNTKVTTQKKKWIEWKRLGKLSGWGFDAASGLYTASPEQWEEEIKVRNSLTTEYPVLTSDSCIPLLQACTIRLAISLLNLTSCLMEE